MNITPAQWLAFAVGACAVLSGSSAAAQLTQLFGGAVAGQIAAGAGLLGGLLAIPLALLTGQSGQVKAVAAMPGVEKIETNNQANATLKALAADDNQPKVVTAK